MPGPALTVEIKGDSSGLADELDKSAGATQGWGSKIGALAGPLAVAGGALAVAVPLVMDWTKAASEDALAQDQLAKAIENSGAAIGDWQGQVDAAITKGEALAFTDDDTRESLEKLTIATGSVEEATRLNAIAMDLARLGGVDLATATADVAKAADGSYRALQKYGLQIDSGTSSTDALALAQSAAAGQADLYAQSATGAAEKNAIAMDEMTESIGSVFLPVLEKLVPAMQPFLEAISELMVALLPVLLPLIDVLATGLGLVADALGVVLGGVKDAIEWWGRFSDDLKTFIDSVLGPIKKLIDDVAAAINGLGDAIRPVLDLIRQLVDAILGALGHVQGLIDAIGNIHIPEINLPQLPDLNPFAAPAPGGAGFGYGRYVNVTVNAGSSPEGVMRAMRRWASDNGGMAGVTRALR